MTAQTIPPAITIADASLQRRGTTIVVTMPEPNTIEPPSSMNQESYNRANLPALALLTISLHARGGHMACVIDD
ncbi:MAG: hypothetical protein Kow0067_13690 [Coriobacteriia bacterium]